MPRHNNGPHLARNAAGYWEIRWTELGRSRRLSTQTRDHAAAQEALALFILGERQGSNPKSVTVAQCWTLYWEEHVEKAVTDKARLEDCWKRLKPEFGEKTLAVLTTRDFLDYEATRTRKGASSSTVRRELSALAAAFNHMVRTRRINSTDIPYFKLPDSAPPRDRWLTQQEIEVLIVKAEVRRERHAKAMNTKPENVRLSRVERFLHIALRTGARKRSIEKLTWGQVDLERRMIDFNPKGAKQTKKRRPVVPIADALMPILERAHRERQQELWVLDRPGNIRKAFESLCTEAELEDVSPHVLRHTWATHAVMAGVPLVDVARVLGNSVQMVVKVYAKYAPEYLRTAVNFTPREAA